MFIIYYLLNIESIELIRKIQQNMDIAQKGMSQLITVARRIIRLWKFNCSYSDLNSNFYCFFDWLYSTLFDWYLIDFWFAVINWLAIWLASINKIFQLIVYAIVTKENLLLDFLITNLLIKSIWYVSEITFDV